NLTVSAPPDSKRSRSAPTDGAGAGYWPTTGAPRTSPGPPNSYRRRSAQRGCSGTDANSPPLSGPASILPAARSAIPLLPVTVAAGQTVPAPVGNCREQA